MDTQKMHRNLLTAALLLACMPLAQAAEGVARVAGARLGSRVAYAETLGQGASAIDARGQAAAEAKALAAEVLAELEA